MKSSGIVWGIILAFSSPALAETKAAAQKQKAAEPAAATKQKAAAEPAAPVLDAEALKKEALLLTKVSAEQRTKVAAAAKSLPGRVTAAAKATPAKTLDQVAREAAMAAGLAGSDMESLVFLVMMQGAKEAQQDLKAITASLKAVKVAKTCKDNACLAAMKPAADYDQKTLDAMRSSVKGKVEGLSELSEMESLRLQTATDRMIKLVAATKTIPEKASEANQGVVQKMK